MTPPAEQITHRILVLGVAAAAVMPRQPSDPSGKWSVGGRLSRNFRILLLAIVGVNCLRLLLSTKRKNDTLSFATLGFGSDLLGVVEVCGLTFLSLLTPYLLQAYQGFSEPGKGLRLPLYVAAVLSFLGVTLSRVIHPNLWCLKKLANAATGPPVILTLRQYNFATTLQSHGRGFVFSQMVLVIEYWHLIVQVACAASYALNRHEIHYSNNDDDQGIRTAWDTLLQAARSSAFEADWTRVLVHAMFMNQLDELDHHQSNPSPANQPSSRRAGAWNRSDGNGSESGKINPSEPDGPLVPVARVRNV